MNCKQTDFIQENSRGLDGAVYALLSKFPARAFVMKSTESGSDARQAEDIYDKSLKDRLEKTHQDAFVAIEPLSGEHFLGATISEAMGAARQSHPDRFSHVLRVGHKAALHIGHTVQ
jgi:hypothetical protein